MGFFDSIKRIFTKNNPTILTTDQKTGIKILSEKEAVIQKLNEVRTMLETLETDEYIEKAKISLSGLIVRITETSDRSFPDMEMYNVYFNSIGDNLEESGERTTDSIEKRDKIEVILGKLRRVMDDTYRINK